MGKRALVCGASRGIGQAAAHELAALGAEVVLIARDKGLLDEVLATLPNAYNQNHSALALDLKDRASLKREVQRVIENDSLHILINNAPGPAPGQLIHASEEELTDAFSLHLLTAHLLTQMLVPGMSKAGYGRIINIVSTSVRQPLKGLGVSNTIRGAVASWSKTLAEELAPLGITINNILPGATTTERLQQIIGNKAIKAGLSREEIEAEMRQEIPAGRFAEPSEIASAVAYLATPAASYITGTNLCVDGGRTRAL